MQLKQLDEPLYDKVREYYEEEETEEVESNSISDTESMLLEADSIPGLVEYLKSNSLTNKERPIINRVHARSLQLSNMTHWSAKSALPRNEQGELFQDMAMRMRWESTEEGY